MLLPYYYMLCFSLPSSWLSVFATQNLSLGENVPFSLHVARSIFFGIGDMHPELPIIRKTYDLIRWYGPRISKFPRDQKFVVGDRVQSTLYGMLEGLIRARYRWDKLAALEDLNAQLDILPRC